jgi:hypothetical protein
MMTTVIVPGQGAIFKLENVLQSKASVLLIMNATHGSSAQAQLISALQMVEGAQATPIAVHGKFVVVSTAVFERLAIVISIATVLVAKSAIR